MWATSVFVDLQITGDALDPREVSAILPVTPRTAYRKGEPYDAGMRIGRTGVWYVSSDAFVNSPDLDDHVAFLRALLWPRLQQLRDVLARDRLRATISIFWAGATGQTPPSLPKTLETLAAELGASIETDFPDPHDWRRFDALTDDDVHQAALRDPDAQPLSEADMNRMRRVSRGRRRDGPRNR